MRIIHTADWHLGQTFFGYDRDEEHEAFLSWLIDILTLRQTDVLLIAGDVFDVANPSAAAQRRFFRFLREANRALRLKTLGNAVCPPQAYPIFQYIAMIETGACADICPYGTGGDAP